MESGFKEVPSGPLLLLSVKDLRRPWFLQEVSAGWRPRLPEVPIQGGITPLSHSDTDPPHHLGEPLVASAILYTGRSWLQGTEARPGKMARNLPSPFLTKAICSPGISRASCLSEPFRRHTTCQVTPSSANSRGPDDMIDINSHL